MSKAAPKLQEPAPSPHSLSGPGQVEVSRLSKELVIGFIGYAGSGCSTAAQRLQTYLQHAGYTVSIIKLSDLILEFFEESGNIPSDHGVNAGKERFDRVRKLQDFGDIIRQEQGTAAVTTLAIQKIISLRNGANPGEQKHAFLLDSLKHSDEVAMLRRVYDKSFRLIAMHCDRPKREQRIIGDQTSTAKFAGVPTSDVLNYMLRDEKDRINEFGQQVREAFYLADFFVDNNTDSRAGENLNDDIQRFVKLLLGMGLVRPNATERAMYHAHTSALQSSCLSRQVGATLMGGDGTILSTGTNDVPKFGGGVYDEESTADARCFMWTWKGGDDEFVGCHNDRKKKALKSEIASWLGTEFAGRVALALHPVPADGMDLGAGEREKAETVIQQAFADAGAQLEAMPGIGDLIEFSRSIHAEMAALLGAARAGIATAGTMLFSTTYPCHSCARQLVAAGVVEVRYIEPYVKSLAGELHYDSIATEAPGPKVRDTARNVKRMIVVPFTGVGPRMYDDYFRKQGNVKGSDGTYAEPTSGVPVHSVRLDELQLVEARAAELFDGGKDG